MSDNTSDPNRIERDLDQTRSRLGSHLSALQGRLAPGQVLDDLMGYFRGKEGAEFGRNLLDNVRGNPLPAALTGIGLVWLIASNPRAGTARQALTSPGSKALRVPGPNLYGREDYGATIVRVREAEQSVARHPNEAEQSYSARLDEARGQAIGLARHAQETSTSFGERIQDALTAAERAVMETARDLRDQVGSALGTAGGAIGSLGTSAQGAAQGAARYAGGALSHGSQAAGQAGGSFVAALTESPVLLGALGLAAGALLGALLPQSDQEEAALGGIAGQARDTVTNLAKEGLERGKHIAQAVADTGLDSAQSHGLTGGKNAGELVDAALSGELVGHAKEVIQDVLRTGDEAVRKEVNPPGNQPAAQAAQPSSSAP